MTDILDFVCQGIFFPVEIQDWQGPTKFLNREYEKYLLRGRVGKVSSLPFPGAKYQFMAIFLCQQVSPEITKSQL